MVARMQWLRGVAGCRVAGCRVVVWWCGGGAGKAAADSTRAGYFDLAKIPFMTSISADT